MSAPVEQVLCFLKTPPLSTSYQQLIFISLTGWAAMLLPPLWGITLLASGFVCAYIYDAISFGVFDLPGWFLGLRSLLTVSVLSCLALAALPLIP